MATPAKEAKFTLCPGVRQVAAYRRHRKCLTYSRGRAVIRSFSRLSERRIRAMTTRYAKIALTLALAAFAFMVTFNNVTDYGSNFAFVKHVLSMDTTFPGNAAMYRAITTPWLWHGAYWLIIAGEALTTVLLARGALALWRARQATGAEFNRAKKSATVG